MTSKNYHQLTREPSGVKGLDEILRGGFFGGGLYIVKAPPALARPSWGIKFASTARHQEKKSCM